MNETLYRQAVHFSYTYMYEEVIMKWNEMKWNEMKWNEMDEALTVHLSMRMLRIWVIPPGWGTICDGVNSYIRKCTIIIVDYDS